MSDADLLELAAKAAGIDAEFHEELGRDLAASSEGMWLRGARSPDNSKYWNPLTNDGDALRLVVTLKINVSFQDHFVSAWSGSALRHYQSVSFMHRDPAECTRRAIVLLAAEIGKAMP